MRYLFLVVVLGLSVLTSGCKTGAATRHFYKAKGPVAEFQVKRGTDMSTLGRNRSVFVSHELLSIDKEGLLVIADEKVIHVAYDALYQYKHRGKRRFFGKKEEAESIKTEIESMHNGSMPYLVRFPKGVSPTLLNALLEAYGQVEIIKISSKSR